GVGALNNAAGADTFAGPITLASDATIGSTAGTLTLTGAVASNFGLTFAGAGNTVVNGAVSGQTLVPGLSGGRISTNAFDTTTPNPGGLFTLTPLMGETAAGGSGATQPQASHIWAQNETWVYTGQVNVPASGQISFGENVDDSVLLKIDGVTVL